MLTDTSIKSAADAKQKGLSVGMYLAKNVFFASSLQDFIEISIKFLALKLLCFE